jgi:hypothetical protein
MIALITPTKLILKRLRIICVTIYKKGGYFISQLIELKDSNCKNNKLSL